MTAYSYTLAPDLRPAIGVIVLQTDLTVEDDLRRLLPDDVRLLVSRVPSGAEVSAESLAEMARHLTASASLFPRGLHFGAVGYGCTSGTAQIGAPRIAELVAGGCETRAVTEPVSALSAACAALGIQRLAFLSPYVAEVSDRLRVVLSDRGITTPVFGTFAEPVEARVAEIDGTSVYDAALALCEGAKVDGLFLSCTNLRTLDVVPGLEAALGRPVLSSNLVLAWDLLRKVGHALGTGAPSALLAGHHQGR